MNPVNTRDMTEAELRAYVAELAREYHPDNDELALLRARCILLNHMENRVAYRDQARIQAEQKAAWQAYLDAKHGQGYRAGLPVVWPRATTDGRRPELAEVRTK